MISDSPYKTGELILKPVMGILVGAVGAMVMIGSIKLLEPISNMSLSHVLSAIGGLMPFLSVWGGNNEMEHMIAGALLLLIAGCAFGFFYSLSEQHIPPKGLIFDGIFYGLVLWVFCGVIIASFLGDELHEILRSWFFLVHSIAYGLCLSLFAVLAGKKLPAGPVAPRD